jgi:hypothetical protein
MIRKCENCEVEIETMRKNALFCSASCRYSKWSKDRKISHKNVAKRCEGEVLG